MSDKNTFSASPEAKGKAKQFRIYAFIAWLIAMAVQVFAILKLISDDKLVMMIIAIVFILATAVVGSTFWKKSNKLDPTSEKNSTRFFLQNQLGAFMGVLCLLPMVISIFTSNSISGKTKAIAGSVAAVAMTAAGVSGVELDAASIEKYTEEIQKQNKDAKSAGINSNMVYWSKAGNKYHAFNDCQYIKGKALSSGSIQDSWSEKGISELCKVCKKKASKKSLIPKASDVKEKVLEGVN